MSPKRRPDTHCRVSGLNLFSATLAMLSQLPCFGVRRNSSRRTNWRARSGSKAAYPPGVWNVGWKMNRKMEQENGSGRSGLFSHRSGQGTGRNRESQDCFHAAETWPARESRKRNHVRTANCAADRERGPGKPGEVAMRGIPSTAGRSLN